MIVLEDLIASVGWFTGFVLIVSSILRTPTSIAMLLIGMLLVAGGAAILLGF